MPLDEKIQLEIDIERASTSSKTHYCKFSTRPKDISEYDSSHSSDSGDHGDNRLKRYNDPDKYDNVFRQDHSGSANRF